MKHHDIEEDAQHHDDGYPTQHLSIDDGAAPITDPRRVGVRQSPGEFLRPEGIHQKQEDATSGRPQGIGYIGAHALW